MNTTPETLRASNMGLIMACPASLGYLADAEDISGIPANQGTGAHTIFEMAVAEWVDGTRVSDGDLTAVAVTHAMTMDDARKHLGSARRLLGGMDPDGFDAVVPEGDFSTVIDGHTVGAHIDLMLAHGGTAIVIDYKSGRIPVEDPETNPQMLTYAVAVAIARPEIDTVQVSVYQFGEVKSAVFVADDLRGPVLVQMAEFINRAVSGHVEYVTGSHCDYCPGNRTCPAFTRAIAPILTGDPNEVAVRDLTPEKQGELVGLVHAGDKVLSGIMADLRAVASESPIPLPDGKVWGPVETPGRRVIDPERAWPILEDLLGDRFPECISIRTGAATRAVREEAEAEGRVAKAAAEREMWDALEDADAVTRTPGIQYRAHKIQIETKGEGE